MRKCSFTDSRSAPWLMSCLYSRPTRGTWPYSANVSASISDDLPAPVGPVMANRSIEAKSSAPGATGSRRPSGAAVSRALRLVVAVVEQLQHLGRGRRAVPPSVELGEQLVGRQALGDDRGR